MRFISEQRLDDGVLEREFTLGEIPGTLWTPGSAPAPLILMAHNNGLHKRTPGWWPGPGTPRRTATRWPPSTPPGAVTGPVPPPMSRPAPTSAGRCRPANRSTRSSSPSSSRWSKRRSRNGRPPWTPSLSLPEIGGPVGYSGWTALGIRLAVVEPRIAAAGFFAGGYVPRAQREEARQVTIPLLFLLQWDDEGNPRQRGPGPVRRLRHQGEDAARQSGRARRHPVVRGGRRGPVLRPAPEVRPGRQDDSRR